MYTHCKKRKSRASEIFFDLGLLKLARDHQKLIKYFTVESDRRYSDMKENLMPREFLGALCL